MKKSTKLKELTKIKAAIIYLAQYVDDLQQYQVNQYYVLKEVMDILGVVKKV